MIFRSNLFFFATATACLGLFGDKSSFVAASTAAAEYEHDIEAALATGHVTDIEAAFAAAYDSDVEAAAFAADDASVASLAESAADIEPNILVAPVIAVLGGACNGPNKKLCWVRENYST